MLLEIILVFHKRNECLKAVNYVMLITAIIERFPYSAIQISGLGLRLLIKLKVFFSTKCLFQYSFNAFKSACDQIWEQNHYFESSDTYYSPLTRNIWNDIIAQSQKARKTYSALAAAAQTAQFIFIYVIRLTDLCREKCRRIFIYIYLV